MSNVLKERGCFEEGIGCFVGEGFCLMLDVLKQSGAIVLKELIILMEEEGCVL